jgi:hypothetical protein
MAAPQLSKGCSARGADMGRASFGDGNTAGRVYLHRVRKDSGGYDSQGAYWGHAPNGDRLYRAVNADTSFEWFLEAFYRDDAKDALRELFPHIQFIR